MLVVSFIYASGIICSYAEPLEMLEHGNLRTIQQAHTREIRRRSCRKLEISR